MELAYIYHSGFAVLTEALTLVFDYFCDVDLRTHRPLLPPAYAKEAGIRLLAPHEPVESLLAGLLERPQPLYVLSTHFHADHYTPEVFTWQRPGHKIHYLMSRDIYRRRHPKHEGIHWLRKREVYADPLLRVEAFGSTDAGVSFLCTVDGKTLFHAGDLNNWHWKDESDEAFVRKAEGDYLHELNELRAASPQVDVAMFPVDPRLGTDYMRGAQQFVGQIKTAIFVPMHFDENYSAADAFAPYARQAGTRFLSIHEPGQTFQI